jgi:signal peptidase I
MGRFFSKRDQGGETDQRRPKTEKSAVREYAEAIVLAVLLALFIRAFVVQAFKIPSGSMLPTLRIGDHILVSKSIYGIRMPVTNKLLIPVKKPKRGDVIVFVYPVDPSKDFIKRVVAVGGDTVAIRDKKLYINGERAPDPHGHYDDPEVYSVTVEPRDDFGPVQVPEGKVFVMGDNRDHSYDSRFWGFVDLDAIKGKAFIIYWSWNAKQWNVRWGRIGDLVH